MRKTWNRTMARLFRLGLPLVALAAAMAGGALARGELSDLSRGNRDGFNYCRNNPTGTYHGCNSQLDIVPCAGVHSANQIYYEYCPF